MNNSDGCEYCREYEDLPEHIIDGRPIGKVFDSCIQKSKNGWHIELPSGADIGIAYCPICGRKLNNILNEKEDAEDRLISARALERYLVDEVGFYPAIIRRAIERVPAINSAHKGE